MFSKSCEYGIKAVVFIAKQTLLDKRTRLNEIALEIDSPNAFTAKILQLLSKEKIITSVMGKSGGYVIDEDKIHQITLLEIVNVIDGEKIHNGCGLGLTECNHNVPCPIHNDFVKIRTDLKNMLNKTTIYSLATNLEEGIVHLKRISEIN